MRKIFKKVSAFATSALMVGLSIGTAAAANFPTGFGASNTAIVVGSGAGVSALDTTNAGLIQELLGTSGGSISVEGGESFALDKSSNHFNFNDSLNTLYSSLDGDELEFLADGEYDDGDIDTEYSQKITLGSQVLDLFADPDYNDDEPTIGFWWTNNNRILNYTLDFDESVNGTEAEGTDLPLLGRQYYVLSASAAQIELLDTADSQVLLEGETASVELEGTTYSVSVTVFEDGARFTVDGWTSNKLDDGEYQKISGSDTYIIAKSVDYVSKESGSSQVEFSLGQGKILLDDGEEVELNDDAVDGLVAYISGTGEEIDDITLDWNSDRDTFVGEGDSISMPLFGVLGLAFGGLEFPSDPESVNIKNGETLILEMGNYDLPVAWYNGTGAELGEEDHPLKLVNESTSTISGLHEDDRFIVTIVDNDLGEVETAYYEVSRIDYTSNTDFLIELDDMIGSDDLTLEDDLTDEDESGDITVGITSFTNSTDSSGNDTITLDFAGGTLSYNKAVSEKGLVVTLPTSVDEFTNGTGATLSFREADEDDDVNEGYSFTATVKNTSNDRLHVSTYSLAGADEEISDDNYVAYTPSIMASKLSFDTSADEYKFTIDYYGEEVTADVSVIAGGVVSTSAGAGAVLVKDNEVSSVSARNLIVVGGSCINSVAAELLGGAACTSAFTENTGVGSGQFLIESFESPYSSGKIALVVAGYEVADTANAIRYLVNRPEGNIDTAVGKKYTGSTDTRAELVVE